MLSPRYHRYLKTKQNLLTSSKFKLSFIVYVWEVLLPSFSIERR